MFDYLTRYSNSTGKKVTSLAGNFPKGIFKKPIKKGGKHRVLNSVVLSTIIVEDDYLSRLSEEYGSDKGWKNLKLKRPFTWHSHKYVHVYESMFSIIRHHELSIFECGIGSNNPSVPSNMTINGIPGASLRMWAKYFPNSNIYGADIDSDILFAEDRIKTFHMDQCSIDSINSVWSMLGNVSFDIFIDDGLHKFDAGIILFENSIFKLKPNGCYIIEDVSSRDLDLYVDYFSNKSSLYSVKLYEFFQTGSKLFDDRLLVITRL